MIQDFIDTFLSQASYEMIDGGKRFYAEIKALRGVWATGKTLEECRTNLLSTLEGWLVLPLFRISKFKREQCREDTGRMPKLGPISLRTFIGVGSAGPYQEGKHPYMIKRTVTLTIPNPHEKEISQDLLVRLLRQAGISRAVDG